MPKNVQGAGAGRVDLCAGVRRALDDAGRCGLLLPSLMAALVLGVACLEVRHRWDPAECFLRGIPTTKRANRAARQSPSATIGDGIASATLRSQVP